MNSIYTKDYLRNTLGIIFDNIDDLDSWNAYNNDEYNDEVATLRQIAELVKKKIEN